MQPTTLVCVPFAGAGASFFHPWAQIAGDQLRIVALQPAGREWRIAEEPLREVAKAAADLFPAVPAEAGTRVALFGHSLGAVIAYELAHLLVARGGVDLARLVVSGSPGPWSRRARRATGLADDDFLERVREFAGYDHAALADPDMRELILPTMRADVEMHENYVPTTDEPLPVPVTAVRGRDDDLVTAAQSEEWSKATSAEFTRVEVAGGHMYLTEAAAPLLRLVEAELARA